MLSRRRFLQVLVATAVIPMADITVPERVVGNLELVGRADSIKMWTDDGLLNERQAARFIQKLIAEPTILRDIRRIEMTAPAIPLGRVQFNRRVMWPRLQQTE